ncbi:hypothetical protein [Streptomyces cucumeris]|uniref:hypothetical protein n=1 Tax=Streptomyces cucumeris TaxID=2962890 RepID=UPI003D7356B0
MKQGTLKTLGVVALGTVAIIAGGSTASAVSPAPVPGGGAATPQVPGQGAGKSAAGKATPDQGLLGKLPVGGVLGNGLRLG